VEKWNIEYSGSKADDGLILFSGPSFPYKTDLIPPKPVFLPREIFFSHFTGANIPLFQYPIAFDYGIPGGCGLAWPK
jgi:hypothetical protein